jgi:hypothetical protein
MTMCSDQAGIQREVADELRLAESSRPEEAMREPIEDWLFDPAEVPRYVAVLHSLFGAAEALDHTDGRHL